MQCFLSVRQLFVRPLIGNNLKPVVLICAMASIKQQRDATSMLSRLRSLIGAAKPPRPSKVPQPGARQRRRREMHHAPAHTQASVSAEEARPIADALTMLT
jgi:hypothetical protein